jgi:ornithine cyclodeaminase/alanine dehydrogenase-like protein (mu-crystallin family)
VTDLATITAILYAARLQRRVPETVAEKNRAIAESVVDARLIVAATIDEEPDIRSTLVRLLEAEPEQPPPSPGMIGRTTAEAKATRRRG